MRYVKAVTLIGGVLLLAIAVNDAITRRSDAAESRRQSLEASARLSAEQLDGSIAGLAAALSTAPASSSLERLTTVLGVDVCSPTEPAACDVESTALDLMSERAAAAGSAAAVVDETRVLVAVDRQPVALAAVVSVSDLAHRPIVHRLGSGPGTADPAATAPLDTEFISGRWAVTIDAGTVESGTRPFHAGAIAAIAALVTVGAAAVLWALVAIGQDHRGLRRQATTDSLTGLPNRAEFERRADAMLARAERDGSGACLVLVDLDRFKAINDTAGHAAGDRVLVEAAGRLRRAVRESDIVGRWGGDEFVLLLAGVGDPLAVPDRVAAIGACLAGVPTIAGRELTASVGAAVAPLEAGDLRGLLDVADRAMYRNKGATTGAVARRLS